MRSHSDAGDQATVLDGRPTIYLSNWSSHRTPGCHGPGRKFTIMARPRAWEHGDGRVPDLTPAETNLLDAQAGRITGDEYQRRFEAALNPLALSPVQLTVYTADGFGLVRDGDTLCCACSRANAAAGLCHRVWAAHALARVGWRVVLDGEELTS